MTWPITVSIFQLLAINASNRTGRLAMNIGSVRHNDNGSISGYIRSLTLDVSIVLRPVTRTNDRSPSFDILARNVRDVIGRGMLTPVSG